MFTRRRNRVLSALSAALVLLVGCADTTNGKPPTWFDAAGATEESQRPDPVDGLGSADPARQSRSPVPPAQPTVSASQTGAPTPTSPAATPQPTHSTQPPTSGPWSTIVDNTTTGRFSASSGWSKSTNSSQMRGSDYRYATPQESSDPAWYKVAIPQTATYRVEVWYPAKSSYNDRTPYIVVTSTGNKTIHVNQRTNGGRWVSLGTFTLTAGDENKVGVSRWRTAGTGYVVADAIRVTRV
ncbi:MAG TPA: hypothetical protein VFX61_16540 [Micromonosporaceae bacterium]|nr:hypothetical protein [Micromonosporaceae bacterium]